MFQTLNRLEWATGLVKHLLYYTNNTIIQPFTVSKKIYIGDLDTIKEVQQRIAQQDNGKKIYIKKEITIFAFE